MNTLILDKYFKDNGIYNMHGKGITLEYFPEIEKELKEKKRFGFLKQEDRIPFVERQIELLNKELSK